MSKALVLTIKATGHVIGGLTRTSGGPVPAVRDFVPEGLQGVTYAGTAATRLDAADLALYEVEATDDQVMASFDYAVVGTGTTAHLEQPTKGGFSAKFSADKKRINVEITTGESVADLAVAALGEDGSVVSTTFSGTKSQIIPRSSKQKFVVFATGYPPVPIP